MVALRAGGAALALLGIGCSSALSAGFTPDDCTPAAVYHAECMVSEELVAAFAGVGGATRSVSCTVKMRLDQRGRVASRELLECSDPALMDRALGRASPIRIEPNNACVRDALAQMTFALSGDGYEATSRH